MQFVSRLTLLALGFFPEGFAELSSIGSTQSISPLPTFSPSSITVTEAYSSISTISSSTLSATPAPTPSTTETGEELILNTIFTQPPGCESGLTVQPPWTDEPWQNIINPVPTLTLTSCYPSQFYYRDVATVLWPPFSQLVCPKDWETYNITKSYIICCPKDYGVYGVNYYSTRPGLDAVCTSSISPGASMDITSYDSTAFATVIHTTAGKNGSLVMATAFDGTRASAIASSTPTASSIVASTTSTTTSSSAPLLEPYHSRPLRLLLLLLPLILLV